VLLNFSKCVRILARRGLRGFGSDYLDAQPSIRTGSTCFLKNLAGLKLRLQETTKYQRITLNILFDPSVMLDCEITIVIRDMKVTVKTTNYGRGQRTFTAVC
jgi:hypothetical protein